MRNGTGTASATSEAASADADADDADDTVAAGVAEVSSPLSRAQLRYGGGQSIRTRRPTRRCHAQTPRREPAGSVSVATVGQSRLARCPERAQIETGAIPSGGAARGGSLSPGSRPI